MAAGFREELQAAVDERHQANHPLIDKWANEGVKDETVTGTICEHWYWISKLVPAAMFLICADAPEDVIDLEMENIGEELNPDNPHPDLIVRFAEACDVSREKLDAGRGLPTTEAWLEWELNVAKNQHWIAAMAAVHISSEAQEPKLFSRILPSMRESDRFTEHELEYWWLHAEVDVEHGGHALAMLEKHCTTRETQDLALHWAREGARRKYLFWDGINLHYEMGYRLQ